MGLIEGRPHGILGVGWPGPLTPAAADAGTTAASLADDKLDPQ